jgi:hypothetical protein
VTEVEEEIQQVQRMLARERLSVDDPGEGRTCFLSHLGAPPRLVPGPWIGHRDLLYALALANLSPSQRTSLARAVLVEHGREFGVGRLRLHALPSGLPFGGSSLLMESRSGGLKVLQTWALGKTPGTEQADWLMLRVRPSWALEKAPPVLRPESLETLVALGGDVVVLVQGATEAWQVAEAVRGRVEFTAHPRFAPHLEGLSTAGEVLLWPHDAVDAVGLRRRNLVAAVLVDAPESVRQFAAVTLAETAPKAQITEASCPGRAGRKELQGFWKACGEPRILLRGDPKWAHAGAQWLAAKGAVVHVQGEATQLGLF